MSLVFGAASAAFAAPPSAAVAGAGGSPGLWAPAPTESSVTTGLNGETVAVEEIAGLERSIESRVREMLSNVIQPDQYAVYVQLKIRADPKLLQQYYDERSLASMPGLPGADSDGGNAANNKLYALVQSKKVIVVLDKAVTGDQELVAKDIVLSKLSIDDKKGDAVDFRRSEIPNSQARAIASQNELSAGSEPWVKWALGLLGVCLAIAVSVLLWQLTLLRERVDSKKDLPETILAAPPAPPASPEPATEDDTERENSDEASTLNGPVMEDNKRVSIAELKDKILSLAVSHPKACSSVARRLLVNRDGMKRLAIVSEVIGFEYTKHLFDAVSPGKWKAMGEFLRQNLDEVSKAPTGQILLEVYTDMLAETMGWDPAKETKEPFDFLIKLSEQELGKLIADEDPNQVALIAAYWEAEDMSGLLGLLNDSNRKQTLLQIARLDTLPREVVEQAAKGFADRLQAMRAKNELQVDGSEFVARVLSSVDSAAEEELLKFIEREDPATREKLRAVYFAFDSIPYVPAEVLRPVIEQFDPDLIGKALVGADEMTVRNVLALVPPKQRAILGDDIRMATQNGSTPRQEISESRKELIFAIRKELRDRGISLSSLNTVQEAYEQAEFSPAPPPQSEAPTQSGEVMSASAEAMPMEASPAEAVPIEVPPDDSEKAA